jgi:hypothetical protein
MNPKRISSKVAEKLGYYVYLLIDPANDEVFYVGKGKGGRMLSHLQASGESEKAKRIQAIRKCTKGAEPQIDILIHGIRDEKTALKIEAAVIDLKRGWESGIVGRMPLGQLNAQYEAKPVEIKHNVILIRIGQSYRYGMTEDELYEYTRGVWKVNPEKHKAKYAFAVYKGIVREVYRIIEWHRGGTTPYKTRKHDDIDLTDRHEFTGTKASKAIREQYIDKSVARYFPDSSRNPIKYFDPDEKK